LQDEELARLKLIDQSIPVEAEQMPVGQACQALQLPTHTHTHTRPFNGPFSETTRVGRYQKGKTNLDFIEARDLEWQWHLPIMYNKPLPIRRVHKAEVEGKPVGRQNETIQKQSGLS